MNQGCPNVAALLEEVRARQAAGTCWCGCVPGDVADAEEALAAGDCRKARKSLKHALDRCDPVGSGPATPSFEPLKAWE